MQQFFRELQRRNVVRAGIAYLAACWLLVQLLETLFPIFGLPETHIRWFVIALAVLFVPFLVLAWIFEWTSAGIRRDREVDHEPDSVRRRARRFDRVIIACLAVAVGYFALDKFVMQPALDDVRASTAATAAGNTVAVLPFTDLSPNGDQRYFSDGLAEELLNLLARIPELRVAARTSSFSFQGQNLPVTEIARALNVAHVLEGSVRRAGDRLRVTAQLVSAADGYQLWSSTFERPLGDVFAIQEEIAAHIVGALEVEMLGALPRVEQALPEAHVLYLQGRYLERQGSPDSMARGEELLRQAVEADPEYAAAWVALGTALLNETSHGLRPWHEGHEMARAAIMRALEIVPDHAGAYAQLSWLERVYTGDLKAAAAYGERALALAPADAVIVGNTAVLVQSLGHLDEAIELHEYSLARAPVDPRSWFNSALAYYFAQRLEEAERHIRKVLALSPGYASAQYRLGTILLLQGRADDALAAFELEQDDAYRIKGRALAYHALGRPAEADAALRQLIEGWGDQWPSEVAQVHAWRVELDEAFLWLEKDYELMGPAGWGEWRLMPLYDNLRRDPRWEQFLARAGVSDAQLAAIPFQVTLPDGDSA